mgnify:CR=1 FL=1
MTAPGQIARCFANAVADTRLIRPYSNSNGGLTGGSRDFRGKGCCRGLIALRGAILRAGESISFTGQKYRNLLFNDIHITVAKSEEWSRGNILVILGAELMNSSVSVDLVICTDG